MDHETFWVGGIECRVFVYRRGRGSPAWMFPDVAADSLTERMGPYLDREGTFEFVFASMLVRSGRHLALLDAGHPPPSPAGPSDIDRALASAGVEPSEVGAVVVSHGHLDHIGGVARAGEPAFGQARHLVHRRELEHWTTGGHATGEAAALLRPPVERGLVDPVDGEQDAIPGVRVLPVPGHTPGHMAVAITANGDSALYVGDGLAHEINVAEPDWNHFSDLLPGPAARSRRRLVERAAREGAVVIGSHLATRGRVVRATGGAFAYRPTRSA